MNKDTQNTFNSLTIEINNRRPTIGIYTENTDTMKRRNVEHLPQDLQEQLNLAPDEKVGLSSLCDDKCLNYQLDLDESPSLAAWYYADRAKRALSSDTKFQHLNFTQDWVYWVLEEKYDDAGNTYDPNNKTTKALMGRFNKFSLQFRAFKRNDEYPTCVHCYVVDEGVSYILLQNLQQLVNEKQINTKKIGKVLCENQLKSYKSLSDTERSKSAKIYPIVNNYISKLCALNIQYPKQKHKMQHTKRRIDETLKNLLNTEAFKDVVPHNGVWNKAPEAKIIPRQTTAYRFGNNASANDIRNGLKEHGPYHGGSACNTQLFFIVPSQGLVLWDKLKKHIKTTQGHTPLEAYSHLNTYYNAELDLKLTNDKSISKQLATHLDQLKLASDTNYFAIYISPYSKYDENKENRAVYYQVKELLLNKRILSQVIDLDKAMNSTLNYWIPNIASAMVSKLGGTPWLLDKEDEKELVIGFGASRCYDDDEQYIGSAFCFNNNGRFQDFECWPKSEEWALIGQLKLAIERFKGKNKVINRIIIHYFKEIRRKDFDMIEKMLDDLNYNFPVVVVKINSSFAPNTLVFNNKKLHQLLLNGSYVPLHNNGYLMYINEYKTVYHNPEKGPYPLKISLQSNTLNYIHNRQVVEDIMQQLHDFTHLHWRSLAQPRIPVTIAYPKYLAHLSPHFRAQLVSTQTLEGLWFL